MSPEAERWEETVGPAPHTVWVGERADKLNVVYLRWRIPGNWKWRSLRAGVRDEKGRIDKATRDRFREAAKIQHEILSGQRLAPVLERGQLLTLGDTWTVVTAKGTGKYPHDTPHRREVGRALTVAARILGRGLPWASIERSRFRQLMRTRVDELMARGYPGARGAEVLMQRLLAVASWLREEQYIPGDAGHAPKEWRQELRTYVAEAHGGQAPEVKRPRHSIEEMRRLLEKAWEVDPRFGLLLSLGAELRLGQVVRARRSDLNLEHNALTVRARGKKKGTVVLLTGGQRAAVQRAMTGYLASLESVHPDYHLFPRGQMPGGRSGKPIADTLRHGLARPIGRTAIRKWFAKAEKLAEVPHVAWRGPYGLRRVAVDAVKALGISREGLQQHGGWTDTQVPDRIYADQEAVAAREEAREIRGKMRGESDQ